MYAPLTPRTILAESDALTLRRDRYGETSAEVVAFLGRLRHVPASTWGRSAAADAHIIAKADPSVAAVPSAARRRQLQDDRLARARLREIMDTMPEVARRIRRRIDEELTILDGIATVAALTRMRRAARIAACALAARSQLTPQEFARLYRPFRSLIPPEELAA